jgi:FkbM family methyltransferase
VSSLKTLLLPNRMTEVVDIGANPIDGDPPYKMMLEAGLCRVTGFEPQKEALSELQRNKGQNERYLPYAIGDGENHILNICRASGMTSFLEPDPEKLDIFNDFRQLGEVVNHFDLNTYRLSQVKEIEHMDFLKIDIQGGELSVFKSSDLSETVVIQTEVSFMPLYKGQPMLCDIDIELRSKGFVPHCFAAIKKWPIAPCIINNNPRQPLNQLLEADLVYVRDFSRPEDMDDEQLKHLALIAHHCYWSVDLALRCVMLLEQRGVLKSGSQKAYLEILSNKQ